MAKKPLTILVVDDDRDTADSLAMILKYAGHAAEAVYRGRDALAVALQNPPKLVFLDLAMPNMSGLVLARELRALAGMEKAVFVCLSGYTDMKYQRLAQEAGCAHFLIKPVDPSELVRIARHVADSN